MAKEPYLEAGKIINTFGVVAPRVELDLAAHAVRVDDLSDFNIFRARARLRRALFGKETHVSFSFEVFYLFSIAESVGDGKNKKRSREVLQPS